MGCAELPHLVLCLQGLPLTMIAIPDVEKGEEVGIRVLEGSVHLIRLKGFFCGPLPGILNTQSRGDHRRLFQAAFLGGLKQHPGYPGIQRHPGHHLPSFREPEILPCFHHGTQLHQEVEAILDAPFRGRVQEWKPGGVAQLK